MSAAQIVGPFGWSLWGWGASPAPPPPGPGSAPLRIVGPFGWAFWGWGGGVAYSDLPTALCDVVGGDASLVTSFGRVGWLWRDLAPPDEVVPLAVLRHDDTRAWGDTSTPDSDADDSNYSVTVYAATPSQSRRLCREVLDAIATAGNTGLLQSDEGQVLSVRRSDQGLTTKDPDPGPDGGDVWSTRIEFRAFVDPDILLT